MVRHRGPNALEMERRKVEKIKKRHQKKKTNAEQEEHRGGNVKLEQIANILNTAFPRESARSLPPVAGLSAQSCDFFFFFSFLLLSFLLLLLLPPTLLMVLISRTPLCDLYLHLAAAGEGNEAELASGGRPFPVCLGVAPPPSYQRALGKWKKVDLKRKRKKKKRKTPLRNRCCCCCSAARGK